MATPKQTVLTDRQREELGKALREKREQLRARKVDLDEQRIIEPAPDVIDTAADVVAGNDGEALSIHDRWLMVEVEAALRRMEQGRYGLSEESDEPIAYARLRSIPWARRTAQEEEDRDSALQAMR